MSSFVFVTDLVVCKSCAAGGEGDLARTGHVMLHLKLDQPTPGHAV